MAKHPSQFVHALSDPFGALDDMPDWYRECVNNGHMVDRWVEDGILHLQCDVCGIKEEIKIYLKD